MKASFYAPVLFGVFAAFAACLMLLWHLFDTLGGMRYGTIAGEFLAAAQIAGGLGMLYRQTARPASIVLAIVFLLFSLSCIPAIVAAPAVYQGYGSFFEQFSLFSGALGYYAAAARSKTFGTVARVGMGLSALSFALEQKVYLHETAVLVPGWIPPNQMFWAVLTTVAFALAALALLINRQARLAAWLMALMVVLFGVVIWVPSVIAHPNVHFSWTELALNFEIAGAAWLVAQIRPPALRN